MLKYMFLFYSKLVQLYLIRITYLIKIRYLLIDFLIHKLYTHLQIMINEININQK